MLSLSGLGAILMVGALFTGAFVAQFLFRSLPTQDATLFMVGMSVPLALQFGFGYYLWRQRPTE
jgi:lipopolysaccharide export LptBFGC system permease protein LptF